MLIASLSFLLPECKIVWQRPSRWTKLARRHPRRNAPLWKRHSSAQSPCVLMATHGYMSDGDPQCHSIALNLTLLPALSRSTVLPCSFSSVPLSVPIFFQCLHIVSQKIFAYLPPYSHILSLNFGKRKVHAKWFTLEAKCLHWLSKASVISFSPESHVFFEFHHQQHSSYTVDPYVLCNSSLPASEQFDSWFTVKSENMMGKKMTCSKTSFGGFQ